MELAGKRLIFYKRKKKQQHLLTSLNEMDMAMFKHESSKVRLELLIRKEISPRLTSLLGPQPEQFVEFLLQNCKLIRVIKDQYLEDSNAFEDGRLFFLYTGIACSYQYTDFSDKPNISRFWIKNDVLFDLNSFQNQEDRKESLQMLEAGELLYISYHKLELFLALFPGLTAFLLWIQIERDMRCKFYQILLKLNVEARIKLFLDHYPGMINRISQDYIALYLGVNRSTLNMAYQSYKKNNGLI